MVVSQGTYLPQQLLNLLVQVQIAGWLQDHSSGQPISLSELQQGLGMPLIEVWLGALLGPEELRLEQQGELYSSVIWVRSFR